jgi:hypothetical protein
MTASKVQPVFMVNLQKRRFLTYDQLYSKYCRGLRYSNEGPLRDRPNLRTGIKRYVLLYIIWKLSHFTELFYSLKVIKSESVKSSLVSTKVAYRTDPRPFKTVEIVKAKPSQCIQRGFRPDACPSVLSKNNLQKQ